MCGKGWVVKGYSAFSRDSAILEGYAERGVVVLLQWLWGMAVLGATGGASKARMP